MIRFNQTLLDARDDIFKLCKMHNFVPTTQQAEFFQHVQDQTFLPPEQRKKGVFGKSGQGPGKTAATTIVANFRTLQGINEQTIVTAPTMRQVKDVWMTEYARTTARSCPEWQALVKLDSTKVTFLGMPKWGIFTATSTRSENFQGYHSLGMTIIVDEASGILRPIWQTLKGTLTQRDNLLIGVGNPNDRGTEFFDAFNKDRDLYVTFTWSAEDSPNVSKAHILRMEQEYGRESDVFRVRVLGEFPRQDPNAVIRFEDLVFCSSGQMPFSRAFRQVVPGEPETGTRQFGIDLARFGSDESVVIARYNAAMVGMKVFSKMEPSDVIEAAFAWQHQLGWSDESTLFCCDAGGMGQGVMSSFYANRKQVYEFHSQGSAIETRTYHDAITEAYFVLRDLTKRRLLHLKNDNQMFNQLVSRLYRYTDGKFRLESKDEFLKRVGSEEYSSPDRADALAMAFYPFAAGSLTHLFL